MSSILTSISLAVFVVDHALLKVTHELFVAADCSQNIIRILFVDFSKAFDVIDHNILSDKFISNDVPEHITVWSVDFLNGLLDKIGDCI